MNSRIFLLIALLAATAQAQQYRWIDEKGRVQYTDTPPPPSAKDVQKKNLKSGVVEPSQLPFEISQVQRDFPVTLYTSPSCTEGCSLARDALNKRGIPFKEVQVWDPASNDELKRVSGASQVPTLLVGRSIHLGFEQGAFDALLDSAGYPRAGLVPARTQTAPPPPPGYVPPTEQEKLVAEPVKPAPPPPLGPYSPGAPPQKSQKK